MININQSLQVYSKRDVIEKMLNISQMLPIQSM